MAQGLFITLEGIEGAGKSTHMAFIEQQLSSLGREVVCTREPGGTQLGEAIRTTLLSRDYLNAIADESELLMMFSARAQHLHEIILPAIESGKVVLCDRFTDSTYAYQGGGRGIDMQKIDVIKNWVQKDFEPDLTLLFDLPVKLGLDRAGKRSEADRFESEQMDFFEKVRNCYLALASEYPQRIKCINAANSIESIQSEISEILAGLIQA